MGAIKDIYDIVADLASRATSKKHKKEIESLNSHIAELESEIAKVKEKLAAEITRLKQNHAAQIARMHKRTFPKRNWVRNY